MGPNDFLLVPQTLGNCFRFLQNSFVFDIFALTDICKYEASSDLDGRPERQTRCKVGKIRLMQPGSCIQSRFGRIGWDLFEIAEYEADYFCQGPHPDSKELQENT